MSIVVDDLEVFNINSEYIEDLDKGLYYVKSNIYFPSRGIDGIIIL
jgi:hypothetical protein